MATKNFSNSDFSAEIRRLKRRINSKTRAKTQKQDDCLALYQCYFEHGQTQKALDVLLISLRLGTPRSDIACKMGGIFLLMEQIEAAIFWFRATLDLVSEKGDDNEIEALLQLCKCYLSLGDLRRADYYNERARDINSTHPKVLLYRSLLNKL